MYARKKVLFVLWLLLSVGATAQQLSVASPLAEAPDLKKEVKAWKSDLNGDICALVQLQLDMGGLQFEGDVLEFERNGKVWWIWMTEGSNWLTILSANHTPLRVDFPSLKGATVYTLGVELQYELVVSEALHADPMSTDAVKFSVSDPRSHKPCALLRMGFVTDTLDISGNVLDRAYRNGEWWLWLAPGTESITLEVPGYAPLTMTFAPVQAATTYLSTVRLPVIIVQGSNPYEGRWFVMANYAYAFAPDHSFGFTVGRAGRFGWYVSVLTNAGFAFAGDHSGTASDAYIWSGNSSSSRLSATAGGMLALGRVGYLYAGVGYGLRTLLQETRAGQTVKINENSYAGLALEAGVAFRLSDHMLLSAGYSTLEFGSFGEVKLGVGYRF